MLQPFVDKSQESTTNAQWSCANHVFHCPKIVPALSFNKNVFFSSSDHEK